MARPDKTAAPSGESTIGEIREMVSLQLGVKSVGEDDELRGDLGAESADVANLVATLEDRFGLLIEEEELPDLRTVRDLYDRVRRGDRPGGL